ncbi:hypothetical protein D3C81_1496900 [compost metagenome]
MCTDNHLYLPAGNGVLLGKTRFTFLLTGQPADFNAKWGKPATEVIRMLFGQQFGWCHQRYLLTVGNGP